MPVLCTLRCTRALVCADGVCLGFDSECLSTQPAGDGDWLIDRALVPTEASRQIHKRGPQHLAQSGGGQSARYLTWARRMRLSFSAVLFALTCHALLHYVAF